MNHVTIIGNLTKAPDMRQTTSGKNVCSFTVAVNRRFKDAQGNAVTDFSPWWHGASWPSCADDTLTRGASAA